MNMFGFLTAFLVSLAVPASADVARDAVTCADEKASVERVIDACSGVIADPAVAPDIRFKALTRRADAYFNGKGDYDHALADASEAVKLLPDNASGYALRGGLYLAYNEFQKAIADFGDAIRLSPNDVSAYAARANAYAQTGAVDKAIADYSEVLRLKPDDANAYYDRGGAYEKKEDYDHARADFEQAIRLQRDYAGEFPDTCFGMSAKGERGLKNWPACEATD